MNDLSTMQMREAFILGVIELARAEQDIVFISNDYGSPVLDTLRNEFPERFVNAGISEQNIISVASGLAAEGKKTFVYSIACFITLRCFEQVKLDICIHKLPVTIVGVGPCFAYGPDGPTHHATEDLSLMRTLAGLRIVTPSDPQLAHAFAGICGRSATPTYIRLDKGSFPVLGERLPCAGDGFRRAGKKAEVLFISCGSMTHRALEVAEAIEEDGHTVEVIDLYQLKPLASDLIEVLRDAEFVFTIEEHTINGGLGSIISETVTDHLLPVRLVRFGVNDDYLYSYGSRKLLQEKCGLDRDKLVEMIRKALDN